MERETRFELATLALARRCSTTELLPLVHLSISGGLERSNRATSRLDYRILESVPAGDCRSRALRC